MFSELANELLLSIAEKLSSERDINAFAQTDRRLYRLLNKYLYRHNVQHGESSALLWASEQGQVETIRKSLEVGAPIDISDNNGRTPLFQAAERGYVGIVELLLNGGANVNTQSSNYGNALYVASEKCHSQVAGILLNKGADINA
ncbi:ankyrin, partial [Clathrospora elynae]